MAAVVEPNVPASLRNIFQAPADMEMCVRCGNRVYAAEKVGPINEGLFHRQCFNCVACHQHLTYRTYFPNQVDLSDTEIYCTKHAPRVATVGMDYRAQDIQRHVKAQQARTGGEDHLGHQLKETSWGGGVPQIGSDAMYINHAVSAQSNLGRRYKVNNEKHHFPAFVVTKKKEKIQQAQLEMERIQREEEDRLMREFMKKREEESSKLQKEYEQEWEVQLSALVTQFEGTAKGKKMKNDDKKAMTVKLEEEKNQLRKNMTVRMQKQKEAMTLRVQKTEQEVTSGMVKEHSKQMLELLKLKQEEVKQELEQEIQQQKSTQENGDTESGDAEREALEAAMAAMSLPTELPPPHAPVCRKRDLYLDPSFFKDLDEEVFAVAERDQSTFTELVDQLTEHCPDDLHKARAIFRWITVKDLNVLEFDEAGNTDSPMGLLRGIKFGTETYHTLFMRLCSYAGLACVEIKGHSKSVGYEPGMKIREDTFQNTWNAVLVFNDWWPVQCNWGARHLVLDKDEKSKAMKNKKQDKIRYQYDEHYFLTDPDEFIQEFWAQDEEWQLLESPVSLEQFEGMPFVRSVFFHYGLEFEKPMNAVLTTDNKGGTEVKIQVPEEFSKDIVFHYQIRFADRERRNDTEFRGAKLERFVFHSLVDGHALFSVHMPTAAAYFLEVFANKIDMTNRIGDDPNHTMMPFRLKCACKFKVVCEELAGKMHPLPNCAAGEWGPSKGKRHFDLQPLTHVSGVISVDNESEIRFRLPRPLHILCKLRMNAVDEQLLERYVSYSVYDTELTIKLKPPQPGQYGLDIYARPEDAADNHTLAHACKYLINCTRVSNPEDIPTTKQSSQDTPTKSSQSSSSSSDDKWGPTALFEQLGLKTVSHQEYTIEKSDASNLVIEIGITDPVKISYHLIREPDEDCRDRVSVKENGKKAKFGLNLSKAGNYLFRLYARKKKDTDDSMANVYNYQIRYLPDDSTLKRKARGKGLFSKK